MNSDKSIQWHILGAGAIGGLWATELCAAGRQPRLIFKDKSTLDHYRQLPGFTLERNGSCKIWPVAASCPEQLNATLKHLLVTTKATQTLPALAAVSPWLDADTTVVLMQNGLGIAEQILATYPKIQLLLASTTEGAYRPSPYHVVHAGRGQTLLGALESFDQEKLAELADSLTTPQLTLQPHGHMAEVLWRKLAINCAINPLTVLYNCRNGELLDKPEARQLMKQVCAEILALSRALGREDWVTGLTQIVEQVARDTASNRSSMLQDIRRGQCTEIDAINGYLCQLAEQHGISADCNRQLVERIHQREAELGCR